jgi:hypothetical protein
MNECYNHCLPPYEVIVKKRKKEGGRSILTRIKYDGMKKKADTV